MTVVRLIVRFHAFVISVLCIPLIIINRCPTSLPHSYEAVRPANQSYNDGVTEYVSFHDNF